MKRKPPTLHRRLPIDFGDEILCPVPVQKSARFLNGHLSVAPVAQVNGHHPAASPSPGGEGRGEGELKTNRLGTDRPHAALFNRKANIVNRKFRRRGFTLVELLVVLALLSLISFVLMAVFSTTQRAFRAGLTQTDSLESGRAVMNLIAGDMETMTPSYCFSNTYAPVNFFVSTNLLTSPPSPLYQSLVGSPDGALRTNVLENFFMLSKASLNGVPSWIGTGYFVNSNEPDGTLYPLYRFYMTTNAMAGAIGVSNLFNAFSAFQYTNAGVWSHLMDGVVNLTVRAYDTNGVWVTNGYYNGSSFSAIPVQNVIFWTTSVGETGCAFYSNAVPASVQVTLGTIEDRTLQHAEGLSGANQSNYLANSAGQVHLFTRRVWIRNVDPTAYQ